MKAVAIMQSQDRHADHPQYLASRLAEARGGGRSEKVDQPAKRNQRSSRPSACSASASRSSRSRVELFDAIRTQSPSSARSASQG